MGLSNEVIAWDIIPKKVEMLNQRIFPSENKEISEDLLRDDLNFKVTLCKEVAYVDEDDVILSRPTAYNEDEFFTLK